MNNLLPEHKPEKALPKHPVPYSLKIENLSKTFKRNGCPPFTAVKDVNATVENIDSKGEFITLIGPSGCGKSTILQMIAGFDTHLPPTTGSIHFHGMKVNGPDPSRGMLFQDYGCYPHLNVLDNITFGLKLHEKALGLTKREIIDIGKEWMNNVHLTPNDMRKYPHELSGGMRQRVALARCLALKPKCLLMDEPFSALDEPTRYEMQDLIVNLWSQVEATILLVSHSISEAVFLGDRVWIISPAPGTIAAEFIDIPKPDPSIPAIIQRTSKEFMESVGRVSECFRDVLTARREDINSINALGNEDQIFIPQEVKR